MQQYTQSRPLMLVCVAAAEDAKLLGQWEHHLQPLELAGLISLWSARHLEAGAPHKQEFEQHLEDADLVLLLLSADFFASPDCLAMMERALERPHKGTAWVIPLLLRPVTWQESSLGTLSPLPSNGKPITLWSNQDKGWHTCVLELRRLLGRRVSEARSYEITTQAERLALQSADIVQPLSSETPDGSDIDAVLHPYLNWVIQQNRYLQLRGFGGDALRSTDKIELETVYVALKGAQVSIYEREQSQKLLYADKSDLIAHLRREFPAADLDELMAEAELQTIRMNPSLPSLRERDRPGEAACISAEQVSFDTLGKAFKQERWLIILGDPGSGKTTLTRWIALKLATALLEKPGEPVEVPTYQVDPKVDKSDTTPIKIGPARLPVLLRISEFAEAYVSAQADKKKKRTLTIMDFLGQREWPELPHDLSQEKLKALITHYLQQGRAVVMLDGMDEITNVNTRKEVVRSIEAFIDEWINGQGNTKLSIQEQDARWNATKRGTPVDTGGNQIIITSRIVGYHAAPLIREVTHVTIEPMRELAIKHFCDAWMLAIHQRSDPRGNAATIQKRAELEAMGLKAAIFDPDRPRVQELASNPLLVTILALVYRGNQGRLPERRTGLYRKAIEILIEAWLPAKVTIGNSHRHNDAQEESRSLTMEDLVEALAPLAAHIHERYATGLIGEEKMKQIIKEALATSGNAKPVKNIDEFIRRIREDVGLLSERSIKLYGFLHLTFQEYLAGLYMVSDKEKAPQVMLDKLDDPRWREPILMALGHISVSDDWKPDERLHLLTTLLDADDHLGDLVPRSALLIVSAMPEMARVPQDVVRRTIRRLLEAYADRDGIGQFTALREKIRRSLQFIHARYQDVLDDCLAKALQVVKTGGSSNLALASASLIAEHKWQNRLLTEALFKALPYDDATWGYPIIGTVYASALLTTEASHVLVKPEMGKKDSRELERLQKIMTDPGRYEEYLCKRIGDLEALAQQSPEIAPFLKKQAMQLGEEIAKLRSNELLVSAEADKKQIEGTHRVRLKGYHREIAANDDLWRKKQRNLPIASEKLTFRTRLERDPRQRLIHSIENNLSWLRLIVLLYGGISDHGLATYITQDDEITTVFKLDKAAQMSYIAELRKRAYWQESWDKDDVVDNLAVHLDTRNGRLLDAALEYVPRFTPLAIFNDSPLTDSILKALEQNSEPSTLRTELWEKWEKGDEKWEKGDQEILRAHALLALLVIDTQRAVNTLTQSLSDTATSALAEIVLNQLQVRRRTLADAVILLGKKEEIGIALLPLRNTPGVPTDAQWGDLVALFFRTLTSVMSLPVKYDDVLVAHSRALPRLNAEIWSYWLSGLAGDDPLYSYAVALDTLGAQLESASALINIQHAYNSKYKRLLDWRPLLIPPEYHHYTDIVGEALTIASQSTSKSELIKGLFYTGMITFAWINYPDYPGLQEDALAAVLLIPPEFHKDVIADIDAELSELIPSELQQDETGDIDAEQSEVPPYKAAIINRVVQLADPVMKARALWRIAHYRRRWQNLDLWQCAIEAAEQIEDALRRSRAFERLLDFALQPANFVDSRQIQRFKSEALTAARKISDPNNCARTLARLALYESNEERWPLLSEALEAIRQITNEQQQIDTLQLLHPHLAENYQLSQTYDAIIKHVKSDWHRHKGENLLAMHLLELHDKLHEPEKWTPVVLVSFIDELVNLKLQRAKNEDFLWRQLLDRTKRDGSIAALLKVASINGLTGLELTPTAFEVIGSLRDAKESSEIHILLPYLCNAESSHLLSSSLKRWVKEENPPDKRVWAYAGLLLADKEKPQIDTDTIRCLIELIENGMDFGRYKASLMLHGPTVFVEKKNRDFLTSELGENALLLLQAHAYKRPFAERVSVADPIRYTWHNITHNDPELLHRLIDYADAEEGDAEGLASLLRNISYCDSKCRDVLIERFEKGSEKIQELLLDSWLNLLSYQSYHFKERITSKQKERMAEAISKLPDCVLENFKVIPTRLNTIATLLCSVSKQVKEQIITAQKAIDEVLDTELCKKALRLPASPIDGLVNNILYNLRDDHKNAIDAAKIVSEDGIALALLFKWLAVCLQKNIDDSPFYYYRTSTLLELAAATTHYALSAAVHNLCEENELGPLLVEATMSHGTFWGRAGAASLLGYLRQTPESFHKALLSGLQDVANVQQAILSMAPKMLYLDKKILPEIIALLAHEDASVVYATAKLLASIAQNERTEPSMRQDIIRALSYTIRQRDSQRPVFVLEQEEANIFITPIGRLDDQLYNTIIAMVGIT